MFHKYQSYDWLKRCVAILIQKLTFQIKLSIDAGDPDWLLHILPSEVGDHHSPAPAFQGTDSPPWSLDSPDAWSDVSTHSPRPACPGRRLTATWSPRGTRRGSSGAATPTSTPTRSGDRCAHSQGGINNKIPRHILPTLNLINYSNISRFSM